jgi:hypothetical protein
MKINVRIYGLPRSGTNFLEFLINKNTDCRYETEYRDRSEYTNKYSAIKHCKPLEDGKDLYIFIIKNKENFIKSYKKWDNKPKEYIEALYNTGLNDYIEFVKEYPNKSVIIPYEKLLYNEYAYMKKLSIEFGFRLNDDFKIPKKRMNRNGGKSATNIDFKINEKELVIDDSPIKKYLTLL